MDSIPFVPTSLKVFGGLVRNLSISTLLVPKISMVGNINGLQISWAKKMTKKSVVWKICFQNMECYEYFNLKSAWVNWNWVGIMWGQIIVEKCEWKKICCSECIL